MTQIKPYARHRTEAISGIGYVRVDFGSCDAVELAEVYRAFAALCVDRHANRALLKAGDDYPPGHYALREALQDMALRAPFPFDFTLALIPSTDPFRVQSKAGRLAHAARHAARAHAAGA